MQNSASYAGGVIYVHNINTQISNCQFNQNKALLGGVLFAHIQEQSSGQSLDVNVESSSFTRNEAISNDDATAKLA